MDYGRGMSEALKKAATEYADMRCVVRTDPFWCEAFDAFIDGAQWMNERALELAGGGPLKAPETISEYEDQIRELAQGE